MKSSKKILIFVVVGLFLALFAITVGVISREVVENRRGEERIEELAEFFEREQEERYQRQLADTYGGKTPQETLRLYIEAVEAGDYELASRYFIEENREKELESSNELTDDQIANYVNLLKATLGKFDVEGRYDAEEKHFSIYEPILVQMVLYPNGIWKIIEI